MNYMSPWIFTTTRCNLKCPYCYVKQDGNDMEESTYHRINDVFLNMIESGEKDYVIYRMAGGEPLLTFDKWFPFTEDFIKKSGGKGYVSVITNLTILSDDMLEKFSRSNYSFGVSLDGFSYSKPSHAGSSSAEIVKENIDGLISAGIKNIDISTVIDADSFKDVELLAEWIAERNLNWGIYLDHFFCGEIDLNVIVAKMIKVIDILCEHNYNIHEYTNNLYAIYLMIAILQKHSKSRKSIDWDIILNFQKSVEIVIYQICAAEVASKITKRQTGIMFAIF